MDVVNCVILVFIFAFCIVGIPAAYRNGVTDGYGYCREKWNPGYRRAGEYLRNHMAHRWPELRDNEK